MLLSISSSSSSNVSIGGGVCMVSEAEKVSESRNVGGNMSSSSS